MEVTDEMVSAFDRAWEMAHGDGYAGARERTRAGLRAVLDIAHRQSAEPFRDGDGEWWWPLADGRYYHGPTRAEADSMWDPSRDGPPGWGFDTTAAIAAVHGTWMSEAPPVAGRERPAGPPQFRDGEGDTWWRCPDGRYYEGLTRASAEAQCPNENASYATVDEIAARYGTWVAEAPVEPEQRITAALTVALESGAVDGAHHKQWALDQVVRILAGDRYDEIIADFRAGEDGPETCDWDEGVAP